MRRIARIIPFLLVTTFTVGSTRALHKVPEVKSSDAQVPQVHILQEQVPQVQISNGEIHATIYLPDPDAGYYRGARFDWSGVMPELSWNGHDYFGKWFERYDPEIHDAIMGPVEAFDPLGFEQAEVGGHFTKIGIGLLERHESRDYHFSRPYPIVDGGVWEIDAGVDRVSFTQALETGEYPYWYNKVVRLENNRMVIEHKLINTGDRIIETSVYNHNFFMIDEDPIGPGYSVAFSFDLEADPSGLNGFAEIAGNRIIYKKSMERGDQTFLGGVTGFGSTFNDYSISIENERSGGGVQITGDRPLSRLNYWSMYRTLCPEPYIDVTVAPGQEFDWVIVYEFYSLE